MKKVMLVMLIGIICAGCAAGGAITSDGGDQNLAVKKECKLTDKKTPISLKSTVLSDNQAAAVVAGNYMDPIASIATISLGNLTSAQQKIALLDSSSAIAHAESGLLYIVNGWGTDSVQVFDPKNNFQLLANFSTGNGSNPQDIIVTNNKAYISRGDAHNDIEDKSDVIIVDPTTGAKLGGFDLKTYMNDDGEQLVRASQMKLVGTKLYVLCQDLTNMYDANTNGKVAVIDTETDTIDKVIQLNGRDPWNIVYTGGKLLVTNAGVFDFTTHTTDPTTEFGGIEVIDVATNESEGIKVDDMAFCANVSEIRVDSSELAYILVNSATITSINPTTFEVTNTNIYTSPFRYIADFELLANGQIMITEQDPTDSGIVVINPDGTVATGPVSVGATPASVEIVDVK